MFHGSDRVLSVEFVRGNIILTESNHFFYCFFCFQSYNNCNTTIAPIFVEIWCGQNPFVVVQCFIEVIGSFLSNLLGVTLF